MKDRAAERHRTFWRVMFAIVAVWTAWVSLVPVAALPHVTVWDKLAHAATYALLTLLLLPSQAPPRTRVAGSWVMLYGVVIEFAQAMTGYRTGDWHDALANLVGILVAAGLWKTAQRIRRARG